MNEEYDVIVCGTGFTECTLSGLLSTHKKKVLHIDRNSYYGGESASLNLTNLFERFPNISKSKPVATDDAQCWSEGPYTTAPESWGLNRDWNVDLIPKFIMANGKLVKILLKSGVKDYVEFQIVEGSYVYQHNKTGWLGTTGSFFGDKYIHKVPATETEAFASTLIGLTEKLRAKSFFSFIANFSEDDKSTWGDMDVYNTTMAACYKKFGLSKSIIEFVGHSIALYNDDEYLKQPMYITMNKLKLYFHSLLRYGNSPFIYPMYGLGTLPEGFSRLSAVYGGIYMLNNNLKYFILDKTSKKIVGIQDHNGRIATCKTLICDPTYVMGNGEEEDPHETQMMAEEESRKAIETEEDGEMLKAIREKLVNVEYRTRIPGKVVKKGKVIRVINILNAPIPETSNRKSCQIILPQAQLNRKTDIYIAMISSSHGICKEGKYVALVSGTVETDDPMKELEPAFKLLGPIEQKFIAISNVSEATEDGRKDNIYVSNSYDAQSHFESATENVLNMWKNIHGQELDLSSSTAVSTDKVSSGNSEN